MDVLTGATTAGGADELEAAVAGPAGGVGHVHVAVALLSLAAAALHFAFAPGHFQQQWTHGLFFILVGWAQLLWAVAMMRDPRRSVLLLGVLNVVVIGVWVLSRTAGVPVGPSHDAEAVGLPDVLATAFEVIVVAGASALLLRPTLGRRRLRRGTVPPAFAVACCALLVGGTSLAFTPRFAGEHHRGGAEAAGHDHGGAAAGGHVHTGATATGITGTSPCERSGPPASEGQVTDSQGHFHRGLAPQVALDQPTRAALQGQQELARTVVTRYPTVADALKAGYRMSTVYVPCIGAHYTNAALALGFDPAAPSELLYDGIRPDSKIVGLSYLVWHPGGAPEGFAGPNDHWHQHNVNGGLCFGAGGVVVGGESMTRAQCTARGGFKRQLVDIWMLHDWVVPGFECTWGTFAGECPELGGRTGGSAWDNNGR